MLHWSVDYPSIGYLEVLTASQLVTLGVLTAGQLVTLECHCLSIVYIGMLSVCQLVTLEC